MDKTVKIRAYGEDAKSDALLGNLTEEQNKTLELVKKSSQLEEEKRRSLEHLLTIERLSASLRQEQAKSAELTKKAADLEARLKEFSLSGANELVKKNTLLEEEKRKSLEQLMIAEQLRESLRQEQAKSAELQKNMAEQASKTKELHALEARVKELQAWETKAKDLTEMLGKISVIASVGKAL